MNAYIIDILFSIMIITREAKCYEVNSIPKDCEIQNALGFGYEKYSLMSCSLKRNSRIDFNVSKYFKETKTLTEITIQSTRFERDVILSRNTIDFNSLIHYMNNSELETGLEFQFIRGFDIDLFDYIHNQKLIFKNTTITNLKLSNCDFNFYSGDKKMKTCGDFYNTNPKSIFQLATVILNREGEEGKLVYIYLSGDNSLICPLVFKNVKLGYLYIVGENSYFSRRVMRFSNESNFTDLNFYITTLSIQINNIELDFAFLNPTVFEKVNALILFGRIKSIDRNVLGSFKRVKNINFLSVYFRSLLHNEHGIEWIKSINSGLNVNLTNDTNFIAHLRETKFIYFDCKNPAMSPPMWEIFPDEDFCLYKDFPFNQNVLFMQGCWLLPEFDYFRKKFSCTYLWLIQYYPIYQMYLSRRFVYKTHMEILTSSNEFKSMSKCNFSKRLELCNRSNYQIKPLITYFDIGQRMIVIETVINIFSYPLAIFGLITNLLVVITLSSKMNKDDLKEYNQYNYMGINSICSCLILLIHFVSWLTECSFPYQVFCPEFRKTLFFQYTKIIVVEMLTNCLRLMNNFTYIAFSFNRISLIGKDHNKLVKFMSDVGVKKYTIACTCLSLSLSVVKFFSFRINIHNPNFEYPIQYDYVSSSIDMNSSNPIYFVFNFISDLLNYVVFLFVHLAIDIGLVVKLKQTLNEKLEKAKSYSSEVQFEKKKKENEKVIQKVILMVILNTSFGIFLKLPTLTFSILDLVFFIYRLDPKYAIIDPNFGKFFARYCRDAHFCRMFSHLADLLFMISLSIQLFFFINFDNKFRMFFNRIFFTTQSIDS